MPGAVPFDESSIDLSQIDFSELEKSYSVEEQSNILDTYVVVDGAPVAPESKAPMLKKVLYKLFSQAGKIVDIELPVENGKTKGFLIIGFEKAQSADKSVKLLNGKKLDVKHRLLVNKLSDVEKYAVEGKMRPDVINLFYTSMMMLVSTGTKRTYNLMKSLHQDKTGLPCL
ncbi:unnamed protein product [Ambrosiozyma monospora]|uniref:Unnamed protein product n=1 Tax=Ambrosiozyma monospora TaxID=43982 RepID=A0A9W6YSJ0_AMBMO|nr:unnamed protein product [Ambrosiozyma monospora]